jgi:signal peptidase II
VRLALVLQFGGAIGNLLDRATYGPVTDFISVGSFPVFNVADSCISVGVALLVAALWLEERKRRTTTEEPPAVAPPALPDDDRAR